MCASPRSAILLSHLMATLGLSCVVSSCTKSLLAQRLPEGVAECSPEKSACGPFSDELRFLCSTRVKDQSLCQSNRWDKSLFEELMRAAEERARQRAALQGTAVTCDVVVAGGSTAALSAALTSAREGVQTCLIEPTDWPGGHLTAGGVPAIDYAWHKVGPLNVGEIAKNSMNLPQEFFSWMEAVGSPGHCWVSKNCFPPRMLLEKAIEPALAHEKNLRVFRQSVVKSLGTTQQPGRKRIEKVVIVQREPKPGVPFAGNDKFLSEDLEDWYSLHDSERFKKNIFTLQSAKPNGLVVVDGTEFGDVLVLSGASYLQGVEKEEGGTEIDSDTCGQAFVFPFVVRFDKAPVHESLPQWKPEHPDFFGFARFGWTKVWSYRRLIGEGAPDQVPTPGQFSLQNWNPGNDYPFGYFFKSKLAAAAELNDWHGGVNLSAAAAGEHHAVDYYKWYRAQIDESFRSQIALDKSEIKSDGSHYQSVLGTAHGLSKFPYLRETRRSVGVGDFILSVQDFTGPAGSLTGKPFPDRIAIGSYAVDIHPMKGSCEFPQHVFKHTETLPFFIPFRALTNRDVANLLVAGKTMAQSFMANAATRLQPIEFSSGIGAGVAAASMVQNNWFDTTVALENIALLQTQITKYAPLDWTIDGKKYPAAKDVMEAISPSTENP